jgi:hypothetical protein
VPKMMKIGSIRYAPHIREIYSYSPNGNRHLDHNAPIDADFLKEVLSGVSKFAKKISGSYYPQKLKKILTIAQA